MSFMVFTDSCLSDVDISDYIPTLTRLNFYNIAYKYSAVCVKWHRKVFFATKNVDTYVTNRKIVQEHCTKL